MVDPKQLIWEDMKPAFGVTEPAAIALACAKARHLSKGKLKSVRVVVNSGIYKNAYTCGIPGTALVGNEYSAAFGALCCDPEKELLLLEDITPEAERGAEALIRAGKVRVEIDSISSRLYIRAEVQAGEDFCIAVLRDAHTNFCLLEKNGEVLLKKESNAKSEVVSPIRGMKLEKLLAFAKYTPVENLEFIQAAYEMNVALAQAGAKWERCTITGQRIADNGGRLISDDPIRSAKALACAAAEARVLGIPKAAMSITGSGTHGIICTMPLEGWCQAKEVSKEKKLRATAISYLITQYIKEYSGKLSAFCGCGIAGGTGLACAICYLMGGDDEAIGRTIGNMAASITGMICTGGNHCCTLKVLAAVDAAFNAAEAAVYGAYVGAPHGICADTPEETMKNMGRIADPGMVPTERTIVELMQQK